MIENVSAPLKQIMNNTTRIMYLFYLPPCKDMRYESVLESLTLKNLRMNKKTPTQQKYSLTI